MHWLALCCVCLPAAGRLYLVSCSIHQSWINHTANCPALIPLSSILTWFLVFQGLSFVVTGKVFLGNYRNSWWDTTMPIVFCVFANHFSTILFSLDTLIYGSQGAEIIKHAQIFHLLCVPSTWWVSPLSIYSNLKTSIRWWNRWFSGVLALAVIMPPGCHVYLLTKPEEFALPAWVAVKEISTLVFTCFMSSAYAICTISSKRDASAVSIFS